MKSLKDISWQVSEEEYRADPALSYSTLAKYEREGFNGLPHLFDKLETPSLTFGSAVDAIITGGRKEFDDKFIVASFPSVPDSIVTIVKALFKEHSSKYHSLKDIDDRIIISLTEVSRYQPNWKPETRAKVIKEKGNEYYNLLYIAGDKTILDTDTYNDVMRAVDSLRVSKATRLFFANGNPFVPEIERLYQLKFKATFDGIPYRNMADLLVVNHKEKWVLPVDLKTSSKPEWDFYKSFVDWRYDIQARLYWAIIRDNMDRDEYFKDFKLLDYKFIVVNRKTLTPLVWKCPFTTSSVTLYFGKNNQIEFRSPFEIGKELYQYLNSGYTVPNGIELNKSNNIQTWLNKL